MKHKKLRKLMVIIGTRPEAIKLAPVILSAQAQPERFETTVVITSQHREMLDQMLVQFRIDADFDLNIMKPDQNLSHVMSAALEGLYGVIEHIKPDFVIVQGDTTTTFAGALAAFYNGIPVAHVEAGLRTWNKRQPFPEEVNRCLTTQLTDLHFAPTEKARKNLISEGVDAKRIWVTGNTTIDALFLTLDQLKTCGGTGNKDKKILLLTMHRRENHGAPMENVCHAVLELLQRHKDIRVVFPVHLSPRVRKTVFSYLDGHPRIELIDPMNYQEFINAMNDAYLILTDSGGVQEEAPSLGKPVLVLRETTERPEGIEAGTARLVGTNCDVIVTEVSRLLSDDSYYLKMSQAINPYGNGKASEKILDVLANS